MENNIPYTLKSNIIELGNYESIDINDAMREVLDTFIKFNIKTSDDTNEIVRACYIYNQLKSKGIIV